MIGKKTFLFIVLLSALSACTTYQVDAAIYKWTDSDGRVNYTQTPPNHAATLLSIKPNNSSNSTNNNVNLSTAQHDKDMKVIYQHNCEEATRLLQMPQTAAAVIAKAKEDRHKYCYQ